uniref:Proline rich 12 n=1 Tax=Cynoglossus semilaevis TaxID=244447 RepID=A0A3P8VTB8_CYNSE
MDRNYSAAGFGDLGAGTGWTYDRSAKASFVYGSSRASHADSELLHRQAYGPPHPLQGYAPNHHPGSLSALFDAGLHHSGPSGPDPSVMNLISALESRGPQSSSSASSLLSQFRTPSWQTSMHGPAPTELFMSGALPGSGTFPSSSTLSAYQHPGSFTGRAFTPSLSLQDTPTFSPSSNGLLSPHDPLLHIKPSSQSSLGFDRLLSHSATYRGSHEPPVPSQIQPPSSSSNCHMPPSQFNLLSSQLHNQSAHLYNTSMLSSAPALPPATPAQPLTAPERASRQDSVIKHYQRSPPSHSTALPLHQYVTCGGSSYQQIPGHHRHPGVSCSPLGEQSPSSDLKPLSRTEAQSYHPIIQPPYSSSSSLTTSSSVAKGAKCSSSSSGYSSSGSSSTRTPHTPPSASSTSSSSSSSSSNPSTVLSSGKQPAPKQCLPTYGSLSVANSSTGLPDQTSPQQHVQSYSPTQPAAAYKAHSYAGFNSPHSQDLSSGPEVTGVKAFNGVGTVGHSFSAEMLFGDSSFGSSSLRREGSPSVGYGHAGESTGSGPVSGSSPSSSISSTISRPGLHSPAAVRPAQSPGGSGATKYLSSILSPNFISSPQDLHDTRQAQNQSYHASPPKPKPETNVLIAQQSQEEEKDDDFLISHLLHGQDSAPHSSQHHLPAQPIPQPLPEARDEKSKGVLFDINKISEERYNFQSVIRTNNTPNRASQTSLPSLDILEQSLSQANSRDSGGALERTRIGMTIRGGEGGGDDMLHRLTPQHIGQQPTSDLNDFLSEPDLGLSNNPHLHNLNQPQPHCHQQQQAQGHHQMSHSQLPHGHPHRMATNMGSLQQQQQQQSQQRESEIQLSHSHLDQLKQHRFDTVNPDCKVGQNQAMQQRFTPMTQVCFTDSLLHDGEHPFFPEMEDMFSSADYKTGCARDSGAGQAIQEGLTQGHGRGQEGLQTLKAAGVESESYDMIDHHNDQGYGPYYPSRNHPGPGNSGLHMDLDTMKTNELPSTVNTDQLGLLHSQTANIGLNSAVQVDGAINKLMGAVGGNSSTPGLISPIFCSSRPKKLLKTSSFHLLKHRREPQLQTKKNYAQEYEFEDDEDKADAPADIRLNSRRLPDILPDLVSSCRKAGGPSGLGGLSPLTTDVDFCHPSNYSALGQTPQLLTHDGPKKRGRKPTKPKREGPPRPRGRPRIRPLPEPPYCRGITGSATGESKRGRGRGRGRDSLSNYEPVLSDGSVGSAPTLGLSPGPSNTMDISRNEQNQMKDTTTMHQHKAEEAFDFKPGFMDSFLDFLKTGKKQSGLDPGHDGSELQPLNSCSSLKERIRPLSPPPAPPSLPQTPPKGTLTEGERAEAEELPLSTCPSPCKPLDEELKHNLETLPSFSSDEEDSVSKNQDLQKSISSAISALYDTPHSLAAAVASAMAKIPPALTPPSLQEPSLSPPLSAEPAFVTSMESEEEELQPQQCREEDQNTLSPQTEREQTEEREHGGETGERLDETQGEEETTEETAPATQRLTSLHLAKKQADAAIAGESEEEDSESEGEGIYRERDEFVVRTEDIGTLKMALQTGREPPPIWRVQKALLQKFSPEIKDGQRQFCATSNYLGYFGDAKMRYQRLYVKFLENINKKDYVRVCSRKPWHKAALTLRERQRKEQKERDKLESERRDREQKERERQERDRKEKERETRDKEREKREKERREPKDRNQAENKKDKEVKEREKEKQGFSRMKEVKRAGEKMEQESRSRSSKEQADPPPAKKKRWPKEVPSSSSESDSSAHSDDEGQYFTEAALYLPPMRKIDSLLSEQKKRLLRRANMSAQHQEALHIFPKMTADPLESGVARVHLGGDGYNRKTLNRVKRILPKQQDLKLPIETCRMYSLYHSLHHYKYHTFLHCKKETDSIEQAADDPGQEEVVQQCMANQGWLESLFKSFVELISLSAKA